MSSADPPDGGPPVPGGQHAAGSGTVVQAGRDVLVSVHQHVHPPGRPTRLAAAQRWGDGGRARQAFLVTSAFEQKYWLAELVQRVHRTLDRAGVDLVLKLPDRDYDAAAQAHLLRRVLASGHDYVGGIVTATEVDRLRPDLTEFCHDLGLPVVFADVDPFGPAHAYPPNAAFVGYLDGDIGALAARRLVAHLAHRTRPRVLIVASREHPDRQNRCARILREEVPGVVITVVDDCAFRRSRAYEAVRVHLRDGTALDAVFCTNDEMALGAVDALRTACSPDTIVVGVDGTLEARDLIDSRTSPLTATVVQDAHRLAECVVHVLERMREHRETPQRTVLDPELYQASCRP
ncbi:substrate-binding domain-containing protein [Actinosynnema sp. NPDC050436]|uniref:sugar ABC transporter substrate-binding protein n=1 Tax=Actinosynnema sp. NPDC050436 TaxID=3155659 RepID=UPI0033C413F8